MDLLQEAIGSPEMLQQLGGHDDVEVRVVEREWLLDIRPGGFDPELGGFVERAAVDVDPDDLVAGEIRACQRPGAAAEVENALARPADDAPKGVTARGASPDEARPSAAASMTGIQVVQCLQPVDDSV